LLNSNDFFHIWLEKVSNFTFISPYTFHECARLYYFIQGCLFNYVRVFTLSKACYYVQVIFSPTLMFSWTKTHNDVIIISPGKVFQFAVNRSPNNAPHSWYFFLSFFFRWHSIFLFLFFSFELWPDQGSCFYKSIVILSDVKKSINKLVIIFASSNHCDKLNWFKKKKKKNTHNYAPHTNTNIQNIYIH